MASVKDNDAESFLIKIGLEEYVEELVVKNKFETISDLRLLANLDNNVFKHLGLPLCIILKIRSAILSSSSDDSPLEENPSCQPSEEGGIKKDDPPCIDVQSELSKSKLLELQRKCLEAQFANAQYNKFTGYLGDRVKQFQLEGKWQGAGGLRVSAGTTMEQAQENVLLAQTILNSSEITYGVYPVPGHGVVTLDRKKGKAFIGNKLSHMRKPSSYKGKNRRNTRHLGTKKPLEKDSAVGQNKETTSLSAVGKNKEAATALEEGMDESVDTPTTEQNEECELLAKRQENIKRNNKEMLKLGLLSQSQATMIGMFHCGVQQKTKLMMKTIKEACKKQNLKFSKSLSKDDLCELLGKFLYENGKVSMIDSDKDITFLNLKSL